VFLHRPRQKWVLVRDNIGSFFMSKKTWSHCCAVDSHVCFGMRFVYASYINNALFSMTCKLCLAYHTISLSFCVCSETVVPAGEWLLSILRSRCSDCGKYVLSGALIRSVFLVAAFPVRFEATLGLW
jgi:hypothetical protein